MAQQKVVIKIPKEYGPLEREAIAERVIDRIIKRTKSGKGITKDGELYDLPKYSESYKSSLDFKIAGKTSKVNLTLTDSMLNATESLRNRSGSITVGIPASDKENNAKSEGNQKGTYGKKTPDEKKARRYLGITKKELESILKEFPIEKKETSLERAAKLIAARRAAREVAEDIT